MNELDLRQNKINSTQLVYLSNVLRTNKV